jgi:hypothetical protein
MFREVIEMAGTFWHQLQRISNILWSMTAGYIGNPLARQLTEAPIANNDN